VVVNPGSGRTVTALSLLRFGAGRSQCNGSGPTSSGQQQGSGEACRSAFVFAGPAHARGMRGQDIAMVFQEPMTALNPLMHRRQRKSPRFSQ